MSTFRCMVFGVLLLFTAPASAQSCAGFTDVVDDGAGFCPSVTWLKNRSVTAGCTSATLFCPGDPVSRLQMAAFMFRLGNALAPLPTPVENTGGPLSLTSPQTVCPTSDINTAFPRAYMLWGHVTAKGAPDGDVTVQVVRSVDGGPYVTLNQLGRRFSLRSPVWQGTSVMNNSGIGVASLLVPTSTYRFALQIERDGGAADITSYQCHMILELRPGIGIDLF